MGDLSALEQAKFDAEILYDMFSAAYSDAQLRAMSDQEFEDWKAEAVRLWMAAMDARRAYFRSEAVFS